MEASMAQTISRSMANKFLRNAPARQLSVNSNGYLELKASLLPQKSVKKSAKLDKMA